MLVVELRQEGDPALDPVVLVQVAGHVDVADEVGAVASGGEHTPVASE